VLEEKLRHTFSETQNQRTRIIVAVQYIDITLIM